MILQRAAALTLAGILAFGVTGCAQKRTSPVNWQHPTLPQEAWAQDRGECRRYARREMEREAGLPANAPAGDNLSGGLGSYNQQMSSYELARIQQRAFDSCMRRLGYVPISK